MLSFGIITARTGTCYSKQFASTCRSKGRIELAMELRRSNLQQSTVSEFIEWNRQQRLILNPKFQRRQVWTNDARSYLIDTILHGYPMPKVYLRTTIDPRTQTTIRDVVDGQQRLRAILDFASDRFALNQRSQRFQKMRFSDLDEDLQLQFLAYPVGVEHLINASDTFVLEVFSRLNSYDVSLNAAERRHAQYQTELKWFIQQLTVQLRWFLRKYDIISTRTMVRMQDDVFFAELVNLFLNGVIDGGETALNRLYKNRQDAFPEAATIEKIIRDWVDWMDENVSSLLSDTVLARTYQLHMLFAAWAHQVHGIPQGRLVELPVRTGIDAQPAVIERLTGLAAAVETDSYTGPYREFVDASSGATTRFSSRKIRFLAFSNAIAVH